MDDPVFTCDGFTFDRNAIERVRILDGKLCHLKICWLQDVVESELTFM